MGLSTSVPAAPAAPAAPTAPGDDDVPPLALHARAAAQLLQSGAVEEAQGPLQECLKVLEERDREVDLNTSELLALSDALSLAFHVAPASVVVAFRAAALVAWLARHCQQQPGRWSTPVLDHLQLYGRLISSAWVEGGVLTQQAMDNNRYLLLLGEIMCQVSEIDLEQRQHWTELASRCFGADFWRSSFFATHLQSLLKIITVCPLQTTQHLAFRTLQACDESQNFPGLLDRVLAFQISWAKDPALSAQLNTWAAAALIQLQCRPVASAGCCLAAFFAERLPKTERLRKAFGPLLQTALLEKEPPGGLLKPCIFSTCMGLCGPQSEISCSLAVTLTSLLPVQLMSDHVELERLQRSTQQVLLPRLCVAMGKTVGTLSCEDQVGMAGTLESWAAAVSSHPSVGSPSPARRRFCSSAFFAVATVAREAELSKLCPQVLLLFLKALSAVDRFREDSQEYRAICLSLVQCGRNFGAAFEDDLLDTFCELDRGPESNREVRLYFWMSLLAMAQVKDLQRAWPVLLRCLRGGETLAARAVALAALSKAPAWELLTAALEAFEAAEGEEIMSALQHSIDRFMELAESEGSQQVTVLLQELQRRCHSAQQRGDDKKAALLFQLLCLALQKQPAATVQAAVAELLPLQQPFRQLFAAHVASTFPEAARQQLAAWLLRRFPDAARAFHESTPAIGEPQPVLRAAM